MEENVGVYLLSEVLIGINSVKNTLVKVFYYVERICRNYVVEK